MAIKLNPDDPETYHDLGEALLLQGKTAEAIATLELAIKIRPSFHDAHFVLGVALASQGRKGDASRGISRGDPAQSLFSLTRRQTTYASIVAMTRLSPRFAKRSAIFRGRLRPGRASW